MFGFRARRRRRILAAPFPADWQVVLHRDVGLYGLLDNEERGALRDELRVFIAEKRWEAAHGFELTDVMRVTIAANASLLTLGMSGDPLRHARTIIVQPDTYIPPDPQMEDGIVKHGMRASGTAYFNGPVVLSWLDILNDSRDPTDGRNVVLHEFAHQLDMKGGVIDGTPPLHRRSMYPAWRRIMTSEYEQLCFARDHGLRTLLNHYGAESPAEFFAVTTECFFETPIAMREKHAELYDLFRAYYRQDPARRAQTAGRSW